MDNEQAFEAEAEFEAIERNRSRSRWTRTRNSQQAVPGASKSQNESNRENSPLLKHRRPSQLDLGNSIDAEDGEYDETEWSGAHDFDGLSWWNRPSIFWLLPSFLLFTLAYGGTIVPKLNLILSIFCRQYEEKRMSQDPGFHLLPVINGAENPQCQIPEVQSLVSKFMLYLTLVTGILSAIVSPKLGVLADRHGRKIVIACSTVGLIISEAITIVVARNPETFSVYWMLFGAACDGLGGSFTTAMALSYAYATDCTVPSRRNVAFGYYQGALFAGIAGGPVLGGLIIKATGNVLIVFYLAIGAHATFILWLILVVPESLTKERQDLARERHKKNLAESDSASGESRNVSSYITRILRGGNLLAPLSILWPTEPGTNPQLRRNLAFLAAVDSTMFGIAMGAVTVVLLYAEYMFGWGTYETSVYVSIVNVGRVTTLFVLLPLISRLLRGPNSKAKTKHSGSDNIDIGIIRVAILFDLLGYIGYSTVRSGPLFILFGVLGSIGGMGSPTLSSSLTKHVPPETTGQLLGALGLLHACGRVVAPTIFNLIYAKTVGTFPQAVLVCLGSFFGLAFVLSLFIRPNVYWDKALEPVGSDESTDDDREDDQTR